MHNDFRKLEIDLERTTINYKYTKQANLRLEAKVSA